MKSAYRARLVALLSSVAALAIIDQAHAAEAAADVTVEQVVVTGVRSAADVAGVPASVEAVDATRIAETVNAINVEDQLKYLPNVFIRKRHIGDTQAPMTTRTSGLGSSARSVIYVDGVLISALIANNNTLGSPRWGMAPAEAIDRVEMIYGPFSAAYPGNSVGSAVEISTHMPTKFEGSAKIAGSRQAFELYGQSDSYAAYEGALVVGDRIGPFAWRLAAQAVNSDSQPLQLITANRPDAPSQQGLDVPSTVGTPVIGAVDSVSRLGKPMVVLGAGGFEHQQQNNETLKLTYDVGSRLRLAYTLGRFANDTEATAATYLRDGKGAPVYAGSLNIDGYNYNVAASAFSNTVYVLDEEHWMNSLSAGFSGGDKFDAALVLSAYDYANDEQRTASPTPPALPPAGTILRLDGTGWRTADLTTRFRPTGRDGAHQLYFGLHGDRFELQSLRYATADWRNGPAGALETEARGKTQTTAAFAQDVWRISPTLKLTAGVRVERWRAFDGRNISLVSKPPLNTIQPERETTKTSPKATLEWAAVPGWTLSASYGDAYRFPTVSELYQTVTTGPNLTTADPNLRPEHAQSFELSAERKGDHGRVRISYFEEHLEDALISQVTGASSSYVQNIDRVRTRGLELVGERRDVLIQGLDLTGSVTFTDPVILRDAANLAAEGKQTPGVPRLRATAVATWRPNDLWTASLAARYSDRTWATIENTDVVTHTWQGFDSYFLMDARVTRKIGEQVTAALGIDNLTDQNVFLFHPFPQRSFIAELNYRF